MLVTFISECEKKCYLLYGKPLKENQFIYNFQLGICEKTSHLCGGKGININTI
jgi:hypothetical protein